MSALWRTAKRHPIEGGVLLFTVYWANPAHSWWIPKPEMQALIGPEIVGQTLTIGKIAAQKSLTLQELESQIHLFSQTLVAQQGFEG